MGPVLGVGIDSVDIEEMGRICADPEGAFVTRTFSQAERAEAFARGNPAECLAGKFAVKEAAFKALAHLTEHGFDLRIVEVLEDGNGRPYITGAHKMAEVLESAGVHELLVSITNERCLASAVVIAQ